MPHILNKDLEIIKEFINKNTTSDGTRSVAFEAAKLAYSLGKSYGQQMNYMEDFLGNPLDIDDDIIVIDRGILKEGKVTEIVKLPGAQVGAHTTCSDGAVTSSKIYKK